MTPATDPKQGDDGRQRGHESPGSKESSDFFR